MAVKDILLALKSYPDPTPQWAIDAAAGIAATYDAALSGAVCIVTLPNVSNFLADRLTGAHQAIADENEKSRKAAQLCEESLRAAAGDRLAEVIDIECRAMVQPGVLSEHARLFDLCIVPSYGHPETQSVAEALIFSSGRPILLMPRGPADGFRKILVAWDGSRGAARALNDALSFCGKAQAVEIVSVTGEKELSPLASPDRLATHLARHGIAAQCHLEPAGGTDAGAAILRRAEQTQADLVVMGAYGQSRLREFVLGGATRTMLSRTSVPVLMSH